MVEKEYSFGELQGIARQAKLEKPQILGWYFPPENACLPVFSAKQILDNLDTPEEAEIVFGAVVRGSFSNSNDDNRGGLAPVIIDMPVIVEGSVEPRRQVWQMSLDVAEEILDGCAQKMGLDPKEVAVVLGNYVDFPVNSWQDTFRASDFSPYALDIAPKLLVNYLREIRLLGDLSNFDL